MACGWLTDKYGLAWQITPANLHRMINDPDEAKTERVMNAMIGNHDIGYAELERAFHGK